ncbi:MAG: DUF2953 domain-containing protein [Methanospirillum sp.]|uniref:DUF2953 domain-containing protein n=1 Tax=Methanospirillum sp. TaxID=45200 RepID=UPI0023735F9C|nr:DUF2953 domain-containing protein [Methanospirillum sp.]MDD1727858.1 DUF2953 domain-containing protein [Methanospirillum sp.]
MYDLIPYLFLTTGFSLFFILTAVLIYRIPLIITFSGTMQGGIRTGEACIRWGPGNICIRPEDSGLQVVVRIQRTQIFTYILPENKPGEIPDSGESAHHEPTSPGSHPQSLFRFVPVLKSLIPLLLSHIRIERITGTVRLGTGDPVSTGLVYGYYHALTPVSMHVCSVTLIPVFDQLIIEGTLTCGFRVQYPAGLVIRSVRSVLPDLFPLLDIPVPAFFTWGKVGA